MGYYSDVRCLIYGEPERMLRFTTAQRLIKDSALNYWKNHIKQYEVDCGEDGYVVIELKLDGFKWYEDFPSVATWMQVLWEIDEANDAPEHPMKGLQYEFARVGEEHQDIETHYSCGTEGWLIIRTITETDLPPIFTERDFNGNADETSEG